MTGIFLQFFVLLKNKKAKIVCSRSCRPSGLKLILFELAVDEKVDFKFYDLPEKVKKICIMQVLIFSI